MRLAPRTRNQGPADGSRLAVTAHLARCAALECSMCRDGCPSYLILGLESNSPRGKNRVISAHLSGGGPWGTGMLHSILACALCAHCHEVCPVGGDPFTIIPVLRREAAIREIIPDGLIDPARRALDDGTPYERKETSWAVGLPRRGRVGYFPGCSIMAHAPDLAERTVMLLRALGVVPVPVTDRCCGIPAFNAGQMDRFEANAAAFLEGLRARRIRRLVVSCPSCLNALRNLFPGSGVRYVHITEEIATGGMGADLGLRVMYHDPCNLARKCGIVDEPRQVLVALGCEVVEPVHHTTGTLCCGGGGGMVVRYPEGSLEAARRRVAEADDLEVDAIVTSCTTCRLRLAEVSVGIPVLDVVDLAVRAVSARRSGHPRKGGD